MISKLKTKKDEKRAKRRNNLILGLVMIVILFGSIFGTFLTMFGDDSEGTEKLSYKGIPMVQQGNMFILEIGDRTFYFSTNPNEISSAKYNVNTSKTIKSYVGVPLYLDSLDYGAAQEIAQNFQGYPERMANACIDEDKCADETLPIKTCKDNIIIVRESNNNKVYEDNNCIYIEGTSEDLIKVTDAFILRTLGLN